MATTDWFVNREEPKNRKRSLLISALIELIIILLLFLPLLTYPDPPPGQEGILINFGLPDQGGGELAEESMDVPTEEVAQEEETPEEVTPATPTPPAQAEKAKEKEVVTTEEPNPTPVKPKPEPKATEKPAPVDDQKEAREKAEAARNKVPVFGPKTTGTNPDNKPGPEGDPLGTPNQQTKINGQGNQGQGSGQVGGGLSNRTATARPEIKDSFDEEGRVVVSICVDAAGNVTQAKYTQFGSNVSSNKLIKLAESNARNWKFGPGEDNQCGTITYTFK